MTGRFRTGLETRGMCADIVRDGRERAQGEFIFLFFYFQNRIWKVVRDYPIDLKFWDNNPLFQPRVCRGP